MRSLIFASLALLGCGDNLHGVLIDGSTNPDGQADAHADAHPDAHPDAVPDARPIDGPPGIGPWGTHQIITLQPPPAMGFDNHPSMTSDLLELYFTRVGDIYVAKRTSTTSPFDAPTLVAELSPAASFETGPSITGDGLTIFFASDRAGGMGGFDIYVATRASRTQPFNAPAAVAELNTSTDDSSPAPTNDLDTIVLSSTRLGTGNVDLFVASRANAAAPWGTPTPITEVNTALGAENNPMMFDDKLTLYFDYIDNTGNRDIYAATRSSSTGTFDAPAPVSELDTPQSDSAPWVSSDAHHVVWLSNSSGTYALYEASR